MLGLFDTAVIKTKTHTTDGRGGVTTVLTAKIAALTCSIQPVRREEQTFSYEGQVVIDPVVMMYENISSGPTVDIGDIVTCSGNSYIIITVNSASGLGTHTEAIMKSINSDSHLA
jgi:hypothetical protein